MNKVPDTKLPSLEKPEPQQISPQISELDAEQLDQVVGGNGGSSVHVIGGPPAPTP